MSETAFYIVRGTVALCCLMAGAYVAAVSPESMGWGWLLLIGFLCIPSRREP